jgi:CelD/BcsL family acetyltransferase involved in cellulose biosynthesis
VLALERRRGALEAPANWHTPVFAAVAETDTVLHSLVAEVLDARPHRLSLSFVDEADPIRRNLIDHATGIGFRIVDREVQRSPFLALDDDWEGRWAALGSKRRTTLKRRRRRLAERGEVSLRIASEPADVQAQIDDALRVEAFGWKGAAGSAIIAQPNTHRFYRQVAEWAAARRMMRLALLRVDGRLVAFDYAIETDGVHFLLKTGFDPAYRDCAPGLVLRSMMIERAYEARLNRYEFLGGADEYKLDWTSTVHVRRRVHAFSPTAAGLSSLAVVKYARPGARRLLARVRG